MTGNEINENIEWNQQRREIERLTAALAESTRARELAEKTLQKMEKIVKVRAELTGIEWNQQRREIERLTAALAESTRAREQAENAHEETLRDLDVRGQQLDGAAAAAADLKHERDTALARVKELEADRHEYVVKLDALREQIHEQAIAGRNDGKLIEELKADSKRSDSLRVAEVAAARRAQQSAETALASARELLAAPQYSWMTKQWDAWREWAHTWLTSHPAPVAAPCAGCASARTAITEALRLYAGGHEHGDVLRAALAALEGSGAPPAPCSGCAAARALADEIESEAMRTGAGDVSGVDVADRLRAVLR